MMLVTISGIKRSGSTAQFNMVRLILEKRYSKVHVTGVPTDLQEPCTIVKIHTFDVNLFRQANYIFTTDRDRKEVRASLERFKRGEVKSMKKMNEHLRKWKSRSCHMAFTNIVNNPKLCIDIIIKRFGYTGMDADEILQEFLAIKPPKEGEYDSKTMLFDNHITSK